MSQSVATRTAEILAAVAEALRAAPWYAAAQAGWPAPIACELRQLTTMLSEGRDTGGCLLQIRDVAEVLLKSHTLFLACDLVSRGDRDAQVAASQALGANKLQLGNWIGIARDHLRQHAAGEKDHLLLPELVELFESGSPFLRAYDKYVEDRNRDIGHGAYRPDSIELAERIEEQLLGDYRRHSGYSGGLDRAFAAVDETGLWREAHLHLDDASGPPFSGCDAITSARQKAAHEHTLATRPIVLVRGDRTLKLSPFVAARVCSECSERDAFLYDSPAGPKAKSGYYFLDYANGHKLKLKNDKEITLLAEAPAIDLGLERLGGEFRSPDVIRLLDDILFDNRYISPDWLRDPLREDMLSCPSGIFWLEAPAHVGKTMFVRGLVADALSGKKAKAERALLGTGVHLAVVPVFFKREYRFDLEQAASVLETRMVTELRIREDTRHRLRLAWKGTREDLQDSFAEFCANSMEAARQSGFQRLVIAFDGLDELRQPAGLSAVDYLPPAEALPEGVTLLLTSRPVADADTLALLRDDLDQRLPAGPAITRMRAGIEHPSYRKLLRDYTAIHSGVPEAHPRFEEVWETVSKRSDGLFLFVSFLCDRIREQVTH